MHKWASEDIKMQGKAIVNPRSGQNLTNPLQFNHLKIKSAHTPLFLMLEKKVCWVGSIHRKCRPVQGETRHFLQSPFNSQHLQHRFPSHNPMASQLLEIKL